MKNIERRNGNKKKASAKSASNGMAKVDTRDNGAVIPPFAHRTPNQLHASIYALK